MQKLGPHFRPASRLHRQVEIARAEAGAAQAALDHFSLAVFLAAGSLHVRHFNAAAASLLRARADMLRLNQSGQLALARPEWQTKLSGAIAHAVAVQNGAPSPEIFCAGRPGCELAFMVAGKQHRTCGAAPSEMTALVFVADRTRGVGLDPAHVAAEFNLTPSEARIVAALAGGRSVDEIAAERRLKTGTVYLHIKRALAKTGAGSQAQLVGLALRGVSALGRRFG